MRVREIVLAALAFHPYAPLILSQGVDIVPHQLSALYGEESKKHRCKSPFKHRTLGLLRSGYPVNVLVADETGLGKTIIVGLFLFSLVLRGIARNILVVVPKGLMAQWHDEMLLKFGLNFRTVTSGRGFKDVARTAETDSVRLIVSLDTLKGSRGMEFLSSLPKSFFDIAIFDEAHHIITPSETLRLNAARLAKRKAKSLVLMSATPFRGNVTIEVHRVRELLDENFIYIRRFKDKATTPEGRSLFPPRRSYRIALVPPINWATVYSRIEKVIDGLPLGTITKLVLKKRAASSLYSLLISLERAGLGGENPFTEVTDDVSGHEPDSPKLRSFSIKRSAQITPKLMSVLKSVVCKNTTYKELELLRLLERLTRRYKVVVFSEYRSTVQRLAQVFDEMDVKYVVVHGGMSVKERKHAIDVFWYDDKVKVLLATDAAGEGINLHIAPYQINYDIPWSPLKLEQRYGRIHRYGQKRAAIVYNITITGSLDDKVVDKLLAKIDNIARMLGDWVYDYIGIAVRPAEVQKMLTENWEPSAHVMMKRLKAVREDEHDPCLGNAAALPYDIRKASALLRSVLHRTCGIYIPNVLETIRAVDLLISRVRQEKVDLPPRVVMAVARRGEMISSIYTVLRGHSSSVYIDVMTGSIIKREGLERYLERQVIRLANFYGLGYDEVRIIWGDH